MVQKKAGEVGGPQTVAVFLLTPCVTGRQSVLLTPHCYFPVTRYPPTFEVHAVGFTTVVSLEDCSAWLTVYVSTSSASF